MADSWVVQLVLWTVARTADSLVDSKVGMRVAPMDLRSAAHLAASSVGTMDGSSAAQKAAHSVEQKV